MTAPYQVITGFTQFDQKAITFNLIGSDGVTPLNITGYTVALHIQKTDEHGELTPAVLQKTASITDAAAGLCLVSFGVGDLSFWGQCPGQIKITDPSSNTRRIGGFIFDIQRALHTN